MSPIQLFPLLAALLLAPLLRSVINRTKAWIAGRRGPPWLQPYRDLRKLLGKGAVYSQTTTWLFRAGPVVGLATVLVAVTIVPMAGVAAPLHFSGDLVLFAYVLALGRLATILAALDVGSSFEAMGASREAAYSALVEPVLLLGLVSLGLVAGGYSLSLIYCGGLAVGWERSPEVVTLLAFVLFVVLLIENARMPIDDPTTHLELTMIHEVMVLDHGGPDLAFIEYAQALKLWLFIQLLVGIAISALAVTGWPGVVIWAIGTVAVGVVVGLVESAMARLRLVQIPQLIFGTGAVATMALLLQIV
ncbi:MAG TPA: NADH-quinone oxidoreductase subunit H [bacterium]